MLRQQGVHFFIWLVQQNEDLHVRGGWRGEGRMEREGKDGEGGEGWRGEGMERRKGTMEGREG